MSPVISRTRPRTRRLVLVGGGHAHVEVLRRAARIPFGGELVVVSPFAEQVYAGRMAARLRGDATVGSFGVDLRALCHEANARFVEAVAARIEVAPDGVVVHTATEPIPGDVCSLNIGSVTSALATTGASEHTYPLRPGTRWRALLRLVSEVTRSGTGAPFSVCVVGGGVTAFEAMLALVARARNAGQAVEPVLIAPTANILPELGGAASERAYALLRARGIRVERGRAVQRVGSDHVMLVDGTRLSAGLTVWATDPAGPAIIRNAGLPVDDAGFLRVDSTLRAANMLPVFGAGDCVALSTVDGAAPVRSRHLAIRAGGVLARNLRAMLATPPREPALFEPSSSPVFIDTSDGKALVQWRSFVTYSALALRSKEIRDRRWLQRYRVPPMISASSP